MSDEQQKNLSDDTRFSKLPDHVLSWLFSTEAADNIREIAKNFNLEKEKIPILAKIVGQVILKEIPLEKIPVAIKQLLIIDEETARKLSITTATKEFLPIRDHLKDIEKIIVSWGGLLPTVLPPIFQAKTGTTPEVEIPTIAPTSEPIVKTAITQKSIRQIVQENKEILNQTLTTSPLSIADFDQPVRGTIKNWLADYVKQKGAERHDQMERGDYLFKSANAKNLSAQEKLLVSQILKSYDENSALSYDEIKKIVLLEDPADTEKKYSKMPETSLSNIAKDNSTPIYREPIEKKDLPGETTPSLKNSPKINDHVINLKDLQ